MRDALGRIQSVALFGGGSDIGLAALTRLAAESPLDRVILAGRNPQRFHEIAAAGGILPQSVEVIEFDGCDRSNHGEIVDGIFRGGDVDAVVVAFGQLVREDGLDTDIPAALQMLDVNYTGAISTMLHAARALRAQGHGHLVVLSSIAGQRSRPDNYLYGSTRAGVDFVAQGMKTSLHQANVNLTIVRPGFVHSKMTEGWKPAPFAVTADQVGRVIAREVLHPGNTVVWVPPVMQLVARILRLLPGGLLAKLR